MIRKLLNKIKSLFTKKVEQSKKKQAEPVPAEVVKSIEKLEPVLTCEHCHKELHGRHSKKENDIQFVVCNSCNCVNKLYKGQRVESSNDDILLAYSLFRKAGINPVSYSTSEDGIKKHFN